MTEFTAETFDEFDIPPVQGPSPELQAIYREYGRSEYEHSFNVDGEALLARRAADAERRTSAWLAGRVRSGELASLLHRHGEYEPLSVADIAQRASDNADERDRIDDIKAAIANGDGGWIDETSPEAVAAQQQTARAVELARQQLQHRRIGEHIFGRTVSRMRKQDESRRSGSDDDSVRFRHGGPITGAW